MAVRDDSKERELDTFAVADADKLLGSGSFRRSKNCLISKSRTRGSICLLSAHPRQTNSPRG